jgi:hypothetical protein
MIRTKKEYEEKLKTLNIYELRFIHYRHFGGLFPDNLTDKCIIFKLINHFDVEELSDILSYYFINS